MKQWKRGMEKWGHYLLAVLCAGVILLSAAWTRDQKAQERAEQEALSDQSQKMAQAEKENENEEQNPCRPTAGAVAAPYSADPVRDTETRAWQTHPYIDFSFAPGEAVRAMLAGEVIDCAGEILIDHGNGLISRYQGPIAVSVRAGQQVQNGEKIGFCSADAGGFLRVSLIRDGQYLPFGEDWE